jgi:TatD DNase family protein
VSFLPRGVDFHCHLDLYPDFEAVVAECEAHQIATLAVTTTPLAFPRNLELTKPLRYVRAALGLHPQLVAERASELEILKKNLPLTRYVGEIGLDAGPKHFRSIDQQREVFIEILRLCAVSGDKVLSVHTTRAAKHALASIEANLPSGRGKPVLHWFTGTLREATWAVELGCYFSINGEMLRNPVHRKTIESLPANRLLTETDGPFVIRNGKPLRPTDVISTADALATVRHVTYSDMLSQLRDNVRTLVSGSGAPL